MVDLNALMIKFLKVLSDPIRLKIIDYLKNNPSSASKIQKELDLSQSYTSHQLKKLTSIDILEHERLGKMKTFSIKNNDIFKLISIIKSYILHIEKEKYQKIQSFDESSLMTNFEELF
jgi:ArsR family transcriptional regulator